MDKPSTGDVLGYPIAFRRFGGMRNSRSIANELVQRMGKTRRRLRRRASVKQFGCLTDPNYTVCPLKGGRSIAASRRYMRTF